MPRSKNDSERTLVEAIADFLTNFFGTVTFFVANLLFFAVWIVINLGAFQYIQPFDPYPFGMLTMVVSLEAIALSIIVLMSQNRAQARDEDRTEADYKVNIRAEKEISQLKKTLDEILKKLS